MNQPRILARLRPCGLAAALALAALGPAHAATNLLVNGGFETGNFTGWTLAGDTSSTGVQCSGPGATVAEGICSAFLSTFTAGGQLSQSFATTVGTTYTLSFQGLFSNDTPSSFSAAENGVTLVSFTNPVTTVYQTFVVPFKATAATTTLSFSFRDDPGFEYLDNVMVTAPVPEPASAALLLAGLGYVAWRRRQPR